MSSIYDFTVKDPEDKDVSMAEYKGKVLLIVNVASKCGFTPQYTELEELQKEFGPKGFEVLGFPCNQFMNQEPGDSCSIRDGMRAKHGVTFPMFAKIKVNGADADPLYAWLKKEKGGILTSAIKWNFAKFLVDREGKVVERYAPTTSPKSIIDDIKKLI
ncbi:glutathione peroxidase [Helicosporidium sp. ATCC 50920]|nr:glutathione peroxidase [Helicosporidium sp. ATCC 50920]|eukprot:KDD74665.1 glutathione peroxidase [Helicosporidium sp. ATCC 50920]